MDRTRIENTLREIISEQLIVDEDQILPESRLVEDLQADSLDLVEILMVVEHQFDVNIDDDTWLGLKTFKEFADYLSTIIK